MIYKTLYFDQLDSTQDEARRSAPTLQEGTVIVSETQTNGRGKPGSEWFSPDGGLYFSIILKPSMDINDLLFITKISADVVVSLLRQYRIKADIKPPNDVLVSGKKICGILVEKSKGSLIIGVGINLNISEFPSNLNATSFLLETGKTIELSEFLNHFLEIFDIEYSKLVGNNI